MRTRASVVAGILALATLGGCYWTTTEDGAAAITASLPRGIIVKPNDLTLRAFLYPARGASVTYFDLSGKQTTDPAQITDAVVTPTEKPIPLDGYPYWEVQLDLRSPTAGSFTINGVPPDLRCRLHLKLLDWSQRGFTIAEGLSKEFSVPAGGSSTVAVDLY